MLGVKHKRSLYDMQEGPVGIGILKPIKVAKIIGLDVEKPSKLRYTVSKLIGVDIQNLRK